MTKDELKKQAIAIRDEKTEYANTAQRVGKALLNIINDAVETQDVSPTASVLDAPVKQIVKDGVKVAPETNSDAVKMKGLDVPISKMITEINVSELFPTGGIGGTNRFTLAEAIKLIPAAYRTVGIKCTFIGEDNSVQTYVYQGDIYTSADSWAQGGGGNMILEWNTDRATTRLQVKAKERKAGMQISYLSPFDGWINEQYVGISYSNTDWGKDANWQEGFKKEDAEKISFLSKSLRSDNFIRNFSPEEISSTYNFQVFIPQVQDFGTEISEFRVGSSKDENTYIANFSREGNTSNFTLVSKFKGEWNEKKKCFVVNDFKYEKGCYIGFYKEVGIFVVKTRNKGVPTFYLNAVSNVNQKNTYNTYGLSEVYFEVNNVKAFASIYSHIDTSLDELKDPTPSIFGINESEWESLSSSADKANAAYYPNPANKDGFITSIKFYASEPGSILLSVKSGGTASDKVINDSNKTELKYVPVGGVATIICKVPIKKGQLVGFIFKNGGGKYVFKDSYWYYAALYTIHSSIFGEYAELRKLADDNSTAINVNNEYQNKTKRLKTFSSPCMLYFDNFATDKMIDIYKVGNEITLEHVKAWEDKSQTWSKGTDKELLTYIKPSATGEAHMLQHQHTYTCDFRLHRYLVGLQSLDTIIAIQTKNVSVGEGDFLIKFDFAQKKMVVGDNRKTANITFQPIAGGLYWLDILVLSFGFIISVTDMNNSTNHSELIYKSVITPTGKFGIYLVSGTTFKLYQNSITTEGLGTDLYITGDSITKGACHDLYNKRWASLVKERVPSTVISARGTSNFSDVLWRLTSEVEYLRPKILLSANGYNGIVNQKFIDTLANFCKDRNIQYVQSMIVGATPKTHIEANRLYMNQNRQTVRFDIACRIGFDLNNNMDKNLFPDGAHPNEAGAKMMAERVFMDIPQLVNSYNTLPTDELELYK